MVPHLFHLRPAELRELFAGWSMPGFRADQVLTWVYRHGVADPLRMTNLPKADRVTLGEQLVFLRGGVVQHQLATDGTQKLLIDWGGDGGPDHGAPERRSDAFAECVLIPSQARRTTVKAKIRRTACISSQIGCPVGCRFCASGLVGLGSNLSAGQIIEQVWHLGQISGVPGIERVTNVVFMGMGEPLANFNEVMRAVEILMDPDASGISGRRITISTVGLPAQIRRLADLRLPVTLAISLHAPDDAIRRELIPWARHVTIDHLIDAGRYYFDRTGREVTIEYILLSRVNDGPEHARQLATIARRLRSNINLIRYNEVPGLGFGRPADGDVHRFQAVLRRAGANVHIRASRGRDIAAACGQLRHDAQRARPAAPPTWKSSPDLAGTL